MFRIRIHPFAYEIACAANETLLDATLRAGLRVPHGCKTGGCGACKMRLVAGEVDELGGSLALSPDERAEGWILPCATRPCSDCMLDTEGGHWSP